MTADPRGALDRPGAVRPGEELDTEALRTLLDARLPETLPGFEGPIDDLEVEQFPAGYSNLTYLVRIRAPGGGDGPRELVLRRPPFGSDVRGAHDMEREHRILSWLDGLYPKAPRPVLFCDDPSPLGAPFYLMERVHGVILRGGRPDPFDLDADGRRRVTEAFADALAALHTIDPAETGLDTIGRPEGYVERQVRGWTERYRAARTEEVPEVERAADWLAANLRKESGAALVHNDFKLDNLVLDPEEPSRIRAVLDWEMATVGDPLMDLGSSLAYWICDGDPVGLRRAPVPRLTTEPGSLSRPQLVARYEERTGRTVEDPVFYYVYGQLKLAGILQQIVARYARGATADPRFAALPPLVRACGRAAAAAISRDRIDLGSETPAG